MSKEVADVLERAAERIYDILVETCCEHESEWSRRAFCLVMPTTREYRFQGALGFGGKFYTDEWRVSCYQEDETPERLRMIADANAKLSALRTAAASARKAGGA